MDTLTATPPGTRSRSRSKTPFLRSSCDRETCRHLDEGHIHEKRKSGSKKSPVQTIIEEEIGEHQNQRIQSVQKRTVTRITSDYSSNEGSSPESSFRKQTTTVTQFTNNSREGIDDGAIRGSTSGLGDGTTIYSLNSSTISKAKDKHFKDSTMKTSTPIGVSSSRESIYADIKNGDLSSHIAYKEYKEAGEYWKKFPKTDYTYSKLSPHRREIAPGVIAMPNMSRRSLEKHHERVYDMIQQNPSEEQYIRKRYQPTMTAYPERTRQREDEQQYLTRAANILCYSSEDEVDYLSKYRNTRKLGTTSSTSNLIKNQSIIVRLMTRIVTIFTYLTSFLWDHNHLRRTRIEHQQGIFECFKSAITKTILKISTAVYLAISSVLYMDLLLLKSRPNAAESKRRYFSIFLLVLVPFLLLGICFYITHPDEFPPIISSTITTITTIPPVVNITQYINSEQFNYLKTNAIEKVDNFKTWSEDYFTYLKTVSQNIAFEAQKIWLENFNN